MPKSRYSRCQTAKCLGKHFENSVHQSNLYLTCSLAHSTGFIHAPPVPAISQINMDWSG